MNQFLIPNKKTFTLHSIDGVEYDKTLLDYLTEPPPFPSFIQFHPKGPFYLYSSVMLTPIEQMTTFTTIKTEARKASVSDAICLFNLKFSSKHESQYTFLDRSKKVVRMTMTDKLAHRFEPGNCYVFESGFQNVISKVIWNSTNGTQVGANRPSWLR